MPTAGFFSRDRIVAPLGFNRWRVAAASVAIHLCIGSVYAWSIFNPPLTRLHGVVASAADDWTMRDAGITYTLAIVFLGLSAAVAGKWLERVGPRTVGLVAACCWAGGFFVGGIGILLHQLWLLYIGYGVIGGCGLGLGYVSPVSTLIKWFPDRRGMATGLAIMGFGGGAFVGAPLKATLIRQFYQPPVYHGPAAALPLVTDEGRRYLSTNAGRAEVVVIGANERKNMIVPGPEGVYQVDTGRTGVAETFFALGAIYLLVMTAAALSYRVPAPGWQPAGWVPPDEKHRAGKMISSGTVTPGAALRTPQFYLLWLVLCLNVSAGIGILGVAKTMPMDIFGSGLPSLMTQSFAENFVLLTSVFNMAGRFFWASASDRLGRKPTYTVFFVAGMALYLSIPLIAWRAGIAPSATWLVLFCVVTMLIFTMYGGGFATIPAYLADLFGSRYVGAIHGRLLTAWSTAGVLGPQLLGALREHSERRALVDLAARIDPAEFTRTFGAPVEQLGTLIAAKTVTIAKLMAFAPSDTVDPSTTLYNSTMFVMAGLLGVALIANLLVRPVEARHHIAAA